MQLVIGYGNPIRADDGFGWAVVEALEALAAGEPEWAANTELLAVQQLTPELAQDLSEVARVIFVDATALTPPGQLDWREVAPQPLPGSLTHHVHPGQLLTLCTRLYGRAPTARIVTVGAQVLDYSDELSPLVQSAVAGAVALIVRALGATDLSEPGQPPPGRSRSG